MTEETIFAGAIERCNVAERQAFLDEACAGDAALRRRVDALLNSHEGADSFLRAPALAQLAGEMPVDSTQQDAGAESPGGVGAEGAAVLSRLEPARRPDSRGRLNHYEVLEVVGQGGFGTVLKGFDEKLQRVVAIKVLAADLAASGAARERFLKEARSAAAVRHENVIAIYAVEEQPFPFLVMEFIDGPTLQQKLDRTGPLAPKQILSIGLQIAEGLAAAHKQGLIHRDVKPANILLENHVERVKLSDFGLARAADDASRSQSGLIAGTPQYMSPEQAEGKHLDQRSDLFSLGSILYALSTGRPPFRAESALAVLRRVSEDTPRPVREINSDIPEWLVAVIGKLHAKEPDARFQSAREVADLLAGYLSELQLRGVVAERGAAPISQPGGASTSIGPAVAPPQADGARAAVRPTRRAALTVTVALAVLALGTLLCVLRPWEKTDRTKTQHRPGPDETVGVVHNLDRLRRDQIPAELLALAGGGDPEQVPPELVAVLGDSRIRVPAVNAVAFSPDGRLLAATGADNTIHLWDLAGWVDGEPQPPVRVLSRHTAEVGTLAFSRDGKTLASGSADNSIILWDVASGQALHTLVGKAVVTSNVAFSPDGRAVAVGNTDGSVHLWDAVTGQETKTYHWHTGPVRAVAFCPTGQWLASAGDDRTVQMGDPVTGRRMEPFKVPNSSLVSVAFSSDSKALAAGSTRPNDALRVWDLETRQEWVLKGIGVARSVAFQPRGTLIAAGADDGTLHWCLPALSDFQKRSVGPGPFGARLSGLAFTPDGRYLATANANGTVSILSVSAPPPYSPPPAQPLIDARKLAEQPCAADKLTPDEIFPTLLGKPGDALLEKSPPGLVAVLADRRFLHKNGATKGWDSGVMSMARSRDGKFLASSAATFDPQANAFKHWELKLWDATTGKLVREFRDLPQLARALAFNPNSQSLAAGNEDGTLQVWDVNTGKAIHTLEGHKGAIRTVAWSPDGNWIVTGSNDNTLIVWEAVSGKKMLTFARHTQEVLCVAFSPDSSQIASGGAVTEKAVRVWETGTGKEIRCLNTNGAVRGVAFSHDAKQVISVSEHNTPQVWNLATGEVALELKGHTSWVIALDRSPDGKLLATGSTDGTARIWNADTGEELFCCPGHTVLVICLAFSADGKQLFTGDATGRIHVWESGTGRKVPLQQHGGAVLSVEVSRDGSTLASCSADKTVCLWDLATGDLKHRLSGHTDVVYASAFSPDGKVLATGGKEGMIKLWDADRGTEITTLAEGCGPVRHVAFSPDGASLAAACIDGPVKVWNVNRRKLRYHFNAPGKTWCVTFSSDSRTLASAHDGGIRVWDLSTGWALGGMSDHVGAVRWVAFHPDGRTLSSATSAGDQAVRLWDLATFQEKASLPPQTGGYLGGAWRADGGLLVTSSASSGSFRLTDLSATSSRCQTVTVLPAAYLHGIALTPEGRHVITANPNGTICVLRLAEVGKVFQIEE